MRFFTLRRTILFMRKTSAYAGRRGKGMKNVCEISQKMKTQNIFEAGKGKIRAMKTGLGLILEHAHNVYVFAANCNYLLMLTSAVGN